MSNLDIIRGRSTVVNLTNQSGSARALGDVVILDTANNESFTTSASSNYSTTQLGIVDEPISVGSNGRVVVEGYARQINVNAFTASRGNYLYQSTSTGVVAPSALNIPGTFGQFLKGGTGTTPSAVIYPVQGTTATSSGSNSSGVSGLSAAGVSALGALSDHRHEGVFSVTSSSSNTLQRPVVNLRAGTNIGFALSDTDGNGAFDTLTITAAGGGTGGSSYPGGNFPLLAYKADTAGDNSTPGATLGDVDATNSAVTFTAPASGNVLVRLSATCGSTTTANSFQTWGLREASSDIAGAVGESIAYRSSGAASEAFAAVTKVFILTGISAGSHTYKWSAAQSSGTGTIKANSNSPAVMEVWALP